MSVVIDGYRSLCQGYHCSGGKLAIHGARGVDTRSVVHAHVLDVPAQTRAQSPVAQAEGALVVEGKSAVGYVEIAVQQHAAAVPP